MMHQVYVVSAPIVTYLVSMETRGDIHKAWGCDYTMNTDNGQLHVVQLSDIIEVRVYCFPMDYIDDPC